MQVLMGEHHALHLPLAAAHGIGDLLGSPAALDSAIRLLDQAPGVTKFGDVLATVPSSEGSNR